MMDKIRLHNVIYRNSNLSDPWLRTLERDSLKAKCSDFMALTITLDQATPPSGFLAYLYRRLEEIHLVALNFETKWQ